jgi:rhomboid protease GluP
VPAIGDNRRVADEAVPWAPGSTDPKVAFEEFKIHLREVTPRLRVVPVVVALNVGVFVAMVATGISPISPSAEAVARWGADYGPLTLAGQPWRLLTNVFLHFGIIHLAANMLALLDAGPVIERLFGSVAFAALYLAAGITGSVASMAVHPLIVSAGASGAIFGVYGALGAVMVLHRETIPPVALKRLGRVAGSFIIYNFAFSVGKSGIDNMAHIGGLLGGAVAGACLFRPLVPDRPSAPRRPALVAAVALGLGLAAAVLLPRPFSVDLVVQTLAAGEEAALTPYNHMIEQLQTGKIGYADAANVLDGQTLPGWRKARATFEQQTETVRREQHATPQQLQLLSLLEDLAVSREQGWERMAAALRIGDESAFVAANREFNASSKRFIDQINALGAN